MTIDTETLPEWRYKRPDHYVGIKGTDLRGSAVDLGDGALLLVTALVDHLKCAVMVGHPAPVVDGPSRRMFRPQIGDLVCEFNFTRKKLDIEHRSKSFGYLLAVRQEWATCDVDWMNWANEEIATAISEGYGDLESVLSEENAGTDEAWYIQYGPNPSDICRWTNCDFIALPTALRQWTDLAPIFPDQARSIYP